MKILENFETRHPRTQISLIKNAVKQSQAEVLPELLALYANPSYNADVKDAIGQALRELLPTDPKQTCAGLKSKSQPVKELCCRIAGEQHFKEAEPLLGELTTDATNEPILPEVLAALARIKGAAWSAQVLQLPQQYPSTPAAKTSQPDAVPAFFEIQPLRDYYQTVTQAESDQYYGTCTEETVAAIKAIGTLDADEATAFLVSKIHHRNPAVRRLIQEELVNKGKKVIPFLAKIFETDEIDSQIMTATVFGLIGLRKGADIMVASIDNRHIHDTNVLQAVFEALGSIPCMKSTVCLSDGLEYEDELLLMAVVSALNTSLAAAESSPLYTLLNRGIINKLEDLILNSGPQSKRIINTVITAKSLNLFGSLYKNVRIGAALIDCIGRTNSADLIKTYIHQLEDMNESRSAHDAASLAKRAIRKAGKKVLAVDDSSSMLLFYKTAASDLGFDITAVSNGREALNCLQVEPNFDLIISDMNMPIMDGIELTHTIRDNPQLEKIPIIMASTESEQSQLELARNTGATNFITKPFSMNQFQETVRAYIKLR
ncbi:MAG: response regulator [Deltaproteobacteria bacterium]|nr:response regulator [Deltaproteobacteria bacterium]